MRTGRVDAHHGLSPFLRTAHPASPVKPALNLVPCLWPAVAMVWMIAAKPPADRDDLAAMPAGTVGDGVGPASPSESRPAVADVAFTDAESAPENRSAQVQVADDQPDGLVAQMR